MRSVKKVALFGSVLAVPLFAAGAIYAWINWFSHEAKLGAALEEASQSGRSGSYLTKFDYICFNYMWSGTRKDFAEQAARLGAGFSKSLDACGVQKSCCNLGSESAGVIGLVTDTDIRCVEINSFVFVASPDRSVCVKPSQLKVVRDTFRTSTRLPGRPFSGAPGMTYYKIEESRQ